MQTQSPKNAKRGGDRRTHRQIDSQTDGRTGGQIGGQVDRHVRTDGQAKGWAGERTGGQTNRQMRTCMHDRIYALRVADTVVQKCPFPSEERCLGFVAGNVTCGSAYQGDLCAQCADKHYEDGGFCLKVGKAQKRECDEKGNVQLESASLTQPPVFLSPNLSRVVRLQCNPNNVAALGSVNSGFIVITCVVWFFAPFHIMMMIRGALGELGKISGLVGGLGAGPSIHGRCAHACACLFCFQASLGLLSPWQCSGQRYKS